MTESGVVNSNPNFDGVPVQNVNEIYAMPIKSQEDRSITVENLPIRTLGIKYATASA